MLNVNNKHNPVRSNFMINLQLPDKKNLFTVLFNPSFPLGYTEIIIVALNLYVLGILSHSTEQKLRETLSS